MSDLVIAIDGPAGAGKSTCAKALASKLGLSYLDTGAMYRAIALKAQRAGLTAEHQQEVLALLHITEIDFGHGDPQPVFLDREDVTTEIRTLEIGDLASALSTDPKLRKEMVLRQQSVVKKGGLTLEGRDATTVIAPEAHVKIYLTASLEERSKRRHTEMEGKGHSSAFLEVRKQIESRDFRDITREESPLTVAQDATIIESAGYTIESIVDQIIALIPQEQMEKLKIEKR